MSCIPAVMLFVLWVLEIALNSYGSEFGLLNEQSDVRVNLSQICKRLMLLKEADTVLSWANIQWLSSVQWLQTYHVHAHNPDA